MSSHRHAYPARLVVTTAGHNGPCDSLVLATDALSVRAAYDFAPAADYGARVPARLDD